jgi:hypothetical protein
MIEYNQEKSQEINKKFGNKFKMFYHDFMTANKKDEIKIPTDDFDILYELKGFVKSKISEILETDDQVKQQEKTMARSLDKGIDEKVLDTMYVLNKSSGLEKPINIIENPKSPKEKYFFDKYKQSKDSFTKEKPSFFIEQSKPAKTNKMGRNI